MSQTCWLSEGLPSQLAKQRGMMQHKSRQHYAGKMVWFRASGGLCSNSSQRLGHMQEDW